MRRLLDEIRLWWVSILLDWTLSALPKGHAIWPQMKPIIEKLAAISLALARVNVPRRGSKPRPKETALND